MMSYLESTSKGEVGKILHKIYDTVFEYKIDGIFVEVGANDGKTASFTYNLGKIGWTGLNFEPIPSLYQQCCENNKNNKNVKNFQIAIGDSEKSGEIVEANTLSTMNTDFVEAYKNIPQFKNHFINNSHHLVKISTMDKMLDINNITNIDVLVIDVEGYEENVLKGFTIKKYNPVMVIIEISDQHPDFIDKTHILEQYKNLREYFEINNYKLLVNDIVDNVYVRGDIYKNLEPTFVSQIRNKIKFPQYKNDLLPSLN